MAIKRDYEGYETIAIGVKDVMKEQSRKTRLMKGHTWGWKAYAYTLYEASQSWILILVVGIGIVVAAWLTDIREGYCKTNGYDKGKSQFY
ncbi:hypothetical protein BC829DRAFT_381883 [Chytridium lagenaria]|nr:hypothetical protein BC829DRAFT_381883 [Chytridium lagenaria]